MTRTKSVACIDCGAHIAKYSKSGRCRSCAQVANAATRIAEKLAQTKTCDTCGNTIHRKRIESSLNWRKRRFCSHACAVAQPRPSLIDRVLARCVEDDEDCWVFTGALNAGGYGVIGDDRWRGSTVRTHRVTYQYFVSEIPDGLHLDHLCRNRACCNPWHLDPVTPKVNAERGAKATATHCKHGHEFTPSNTGRSANGTRYCRACLRLHNAKRRA